MNRPLPQEIPKPSGDLLGVCRLGRERKGVRIVEPVYAVPKKIKSNKRGGAPSQ